MRNGSTPKMLGHRTVLGPFCSHCSQRLSYVVKKLGSGRKHAKNNFQE